MLLEHAGYEGPGEPTLMDEVGLDLEGTHVDDLVAAVVRRGINHRAWHGDVSLRDVQDLLDDHAVMVCYQSKILQVGHFAVVTQLEDTHLLLDDPWFGPNHRLELEEFLACWRSEPKGSPPRPRWLLAIRKR